VTVNAPANMAAVMVLFSLGGAHFPNIATNAGNATPYVSKSNRQIAASPLY